MPQQHTGMTYAGAAGFNATAFQQFQPAPQQQPMMRQFQPATTHHPYPQQQPPQIMQMNPAAGGMAIMDTSQMLQGTTPPTLSYMAHHQPIQQPTSTVSQQMQAPKAPSKAIKIVNPNTMKEVDLNVGKQTSSPVSSARSTPKPESEQVQQQFKQNVHGIASTTNDDVTTSLPIATVTPLVPGSDVTTTVMVDSSTNLASTTLTDEKPKPTITPPVVSKSSDVTQSSTSALTSESVHQKEFISEVALIKDTVSSEIIAKEESEAASEELTVVSNTLQSSEEAQVEQPELPPEANKELLLPEQHEIEVSGGSSSSSISHEDSKAEETEDVNKPDVNMDIKMADDILSEQKGIVYKPDDVETTVLEQQAAAECTKDVADEDGNVLVAPPELSRPTSDELPSSEGKQHASEEVLVTLTRMESGGDEPEESDKDLPPVEEVKDDDGMH